MKQIEYKFGENVNIIVNPDQSNLDSIYMETFIKISSVANFLCCGEIFDEETAKSFETKSLDFQSYLNKVFNNIQKEDNKLQYNMSLLYLAIARAFEKILIDTKDKRKREKLFSLCLNNIFKNTNKIEQDEIRQTILQNSLLMLESIINCPTLDRKAVLSKTDKEFLRLKEILLDLFYKNLQIKDCNSMVEPTNVWGDSILGRNFSQLYKVKNRKNKKFLKKILKFSKVYKPQFSNYVLSKEKDDSFKMVYVGSEDSKEIIKTNSKYDKLYDYFLICKLSNNKNDVSKFFGEESSSVITDSSESNSVFSGGFARVHQINPLFSTISEYCLAINNGNRKDIKNIKELFLISLRQLVDTLNEQQDNPAFLKELDFYLNFPIKISCGFNSPNKQASTTTLADFLLYINDTNLLKLYRNKNLVKKAIKLLNIDKQSYSSEVKQPSIKIYTQEQMKQRTKSFSMQTPDADSTKGEKAVEALLTDNGLYDKPAFVKRLKRKIKKAKCNKNSCSISKESYSIEERISEPMTVLQGFDTFKEILRTVPSVQNSFYSVPLLVINSSSEDTEFSEESENKIGLHESLESESLQEDTQYSSFDISQETVLLKSNVERLNSKNSETTISLHQI